MAGAQRAPSGQVTIVVDEGLLAPAGAGLCERLRALLDGSEADLAVIDVAAVTDPDVGTVDALARVLLTGRRLGRDVRLRHVSRRLEELLAFAGLDDLVAPTGRGSGVQAAGQAEEGEHPRGVEEGVDPADPTG